MAPDASTRVKMVALLTEAEYLADVLSTVEQDHRLLFEILAEVVVDDLRESYRTQSIARPRRPRLNTNRFLMKW